jgi:hypothetical protein
MRILRRSVLIGSWAVVVVAVGADRQPASAQAERRLTSAELRSTLVGRVFSYRTTKIPGGDLHKPGDVIWRERSDGGYSVFRVFARDDGSIVFFCTSYSRDGRTSECPSRVRDVGTWSVDGDRLCSQYSSIRGSSEICYEFYAIGGAIRAKQVRGPRSTLDGEWITLQ